MRRLIYTKLTFVIPDSEYKLYNNCICKMKFAPYFQEKKYMKGSKSTMVKNLVDD